MGTLSFGVNGASYYDYARQGRIYTSVGTITAPTAYTTAAVIGPLLWNNTSLLNPVNAVLLGITCAISTASTVSTALGIAIGGVQAAAPTTTTAVTVSGNTRAGAPPPTVNIYNAGTVSTASANFLPLMQVGTGPITGIEAANVFVPIDGLVIIPPTYWCAVTGFVVVSTLVAQIGLVWAEIPV